MQLGIRLSLGRGFAVPLCSELRIDRNAKPALVHKSQVSLCAWIALFSRLPLPNQSLGVIGGYAATVEVDAPQLILRRRIAVAGCLREPVDGLLSIGLDVATKVVAGGQSRLGHGIICGNSLLDSGEVCGIAWTNVRPA